MATTHLLFGSTHLLIRTPSPLVQSSLQWRNTTTTPPSFNPNFAPLRSSHSHSIKLSHRCTAKPPLNPKSEPDTRPKYWDPVQVNYNYLLEDMILKAVKKAAIGLVLMGVLLMNMSDPLSAWAASGGRMGGRSSSSDSASYGSGSSSYGSSSRSSSYGSGSSSRSSSYGSRSSSYGSSSRSSSYRSRSGSGSSGSCSSWFGSSWYDSPSYRSSSHPSSSCSGKNSSSSDPDMDVSESSLFFNSPSGSGGNSSSPDPNMILLGVVLLRIISAAIFSVILVSICLLLVESYRRANAETATVIKLQVGLSGSARLLQRELDGIAKTTNTSTSRGLSHILTETTVAMLRHPEYFISATSSEHLKRSFESSETKFNELSIEERGKFDEETLVNVNNVRRQRPTSRKSDGLSNEHIVITILVEAKGSHKLPTIKGSKDLKDALQKLGSILPSQIRAVEVLWTPQDENDTLTEKELLEDYPLLRPIS